MTSANTELKKRSKALQASMAEKVQALNALEAHWRSVLETTREDAERLAARERMECAAKIHMLEVEKAEKEARAARDAAKAKAAALAAAEAAEAKAAKEKAEKEARARACPAVCRTCRPGGRAGGAGRPLDAATGVCAFHCSTGGYCGVGRAYERGGTDCSKCAA